MIKNLQLIKKTLMILSIALLPMGAAFSQTDPGDSGLGDPDPSAVPIDGGIALLVAAGAGLGTKKLIQQRRKKEEQKQEGDFK